MYLRILKKIKKHYKFIIKGVFNLRLYIAWMVTNEATREQRLILYEHAVRDLTMKLLNDGIIKIKKEKYFHPYAGNVEKYSATIIHNFELTEKEAEL